MLQRIVPIIAADPPTGIVIDSTGADHLHGGEAAMLATLVEKLEIEFVRPGTGLMNLGGGSKPRIQRIPALDTHFRGALQRAHAKLASIFGARQRRQMKSIGWPWDRSDLERRTLPRLSRAISRKPTTSTISPYAAYVQCPFRWRESRRQYRRLQPETKYGCARHTRQER